jgi:TPR repeat protein
MSRRLFWLVTAPLVGILLSIKPAWGALVPQVIPKASTAYEQGLQYYFGRGVPQDSKQAAVFFEQAATRENHPAAQFNLGVLYEQGEGLRKDIQAAVYWYQKAAHQNYAKAQYNLGYLLLEGFGVPKDPVVALHWLEKAAHQGYVQAEYQVGCAYLEAKGVSQNRALALTWLRRAAAHHHKDAQQALILAQSMTP